MIEQEINAEEKLEPAANKGSDAAAQFSAAGDLASKENSDLINGSNRRYDHIVVVIEENHGFQGVKPDQPSYPRIIGSNQAPFINSLAQGGRLFTDAHAMTHPSQPNYFALFSGSTQGVRDNFNHTFTSVPNLASQLEGAGLTFKGYVDAGSPRKHNPWESFTNAQHMGADMKDFPKDFNKLPTVSFVIPNLDHDMHDGSVADADKWLKDNLGDYAEWAKTHNSLLIVMTDEDDFKQDNHIPVIAYGDGISPSREPQRITTVGVLHGLEKHYGLPLLGDKAEPANLDRDKN